MTTPLSMDFLTFIKNNSFCEEYLVNTLRPRLRCLLAANCYTQHKESIQVVLYIEYCFIQYKRHYPIHPPFDLDTRDLVDQIFRNETQAILRSI